MTGRKSTWGDAFLKAALITAFVAGIPTSFADVTNTDVSPKKPRAVPWNPSLPSLPSPSTRGSLPDDNRPSVSSAVILQLQGNVYPLGLYYVMIGIGNPPKPYFLDVDTGSDLTWVQCDAPCISCSKGPHPLYKPMKNRLVPCKDPICAAVQESTSHEGRGCQTPEQCDYEIEYQDQGHSRGVLVTDFFAFRLRNSTVVRPSLAFGCGYDQHGEHSATDGVLGLGFGKASIPSQLRDLGVCRNVMGHCLGRQRAGFLFFGDDVVRPQILTWAPISRIGQHNYYSPGLATVNAGKELLATRQTMVFDSGSSYTYFSNHLLQSLLNAINNDVSKTSLKAAPEEKALPNCWKGPTPFKSVLELKKYFRPLILGFGSGKAPAVMEIPPENYFIVTKQGNACLGVLDGSREGLGELNLIGDISMQDVVVVYDNERQRIGWARVAGCDLPKSGASSPRGGDWNGLIPGKFSFDTFGHMMSVLQAGFCW